MILLRCNWRARMPMLVSLLAILLSTAPSERAQAPSTLTTLRAIHALSSVEAAKQLPVAFDATVTLATQGAMFVQDGDLAIYVSSLPDNLKLAPGDRVFIAGTTHASFRTSVIYGHVIVLGHGSLPKPVPATYDGLLDAKFDCRLVTVHGVVRSIASETALNLGVPSLRLLMDGGYIDAGLMSGSFPAKSLLDAEVEVTGIVSGEFEAKTILDGESYLSGIMLFVPTAAGVRIVKPSETSPWSLPITPMNQILVGHHVNNLSRRILVQGVITYYQPGSTVVLQSGSQSLPIRTQSDTPMQIGDKAEATGIPDVYEGVWSLTEGDVRDLHVSVPIKPQTATWDDIAAKKYDSDLVSVEGRVVVKIREALQDEYILVSHGYIFSAIYRHPDEFRGLPLPPMKDVPIGSGVRVTGVCLPERANPFSANTYSLMMRSSSDVEVLTSPSLLNVRNLMIVIFVLVALVFAAGLRSWKIERKLRRQSAAMAVRTRLEADLERRRSRILEDINGSRPLAGIVEEIMKLVSSSLNGAPCWCELTGSGRIGPLPPGAEDARIICEAIPSRSGTPSGTLSVALETEDPQLPHAREREALSIGTKLAALAIETQHLYSDLRRRSEFDLLTDVPNRFALEKFMEMRIEEASPSGEILGLIYIDLDHFKPINDKYGHHVGDLYLQAAALRMSRQLLGGDMLARLGGDEFAAFVSLSNSQRDRDKIVARLESCFRSPFVLDGHTIIGSASIGVALYPADAATIDGLLRAADSAMYAVKRKKQEQTGVPGQHDGLANHP
jgi:diguanylate cyclase (GGDEF)-like protein